MLGGGAQIGRGVDLVTGAFELLLERPAEQLLVLDEQDEGHGGQTSVAGAGGPDSGSMTKKVVPRPGSLSQSSRPPC